MSADERRERALRLLRTLLAFEEARVQDASAKIVGSSSVLETIGDARSLLDEVMGVRPAPVEDIGPSVRVGDELWVLDRGMRTKPMRLAIVSESSTHLAFDYFRSRVKVPKVAPELPVTAPNTRWVSRPIGSGLDIFLTAKAMDDERWIEAHGHRIAARLRETHEVELLRRVAMLLGYDADPKLTEADFDSVRRR